MTNEMELKKEDIDFTHVFKVVKINEDKVTFKKYVVRRLMSMNEGFEIVSLTDEIGEETHPCKPDVLMKLAGKVGIIVKEFKCELIGKRKDRIMVVDVVLLARDNKNEKM